MVKRCKGIILFSILSIIMLGLTGCADTYKTLAEKWDDFTGYLADAVPDNLTKNISESLESANNVMGEMKLTDDNDLCGQRTTEGNDYLGTYHSDYKKYTGEEYLFGGVSVDSKNISKIKISYSLSQKAGNVKILLVTGKEEKQLFKDTDKSGSKIVALQGGTNYVVIKCEKFSGTVDLTVAAE